MAVEPRRGCGYRKIGATYLVCGSSGITCDRLPHPLHVCPTCSQGIKQARGWTWCNAMELFGGFHEEKDCKDRRSKCALCTRTDEFVKAGLLWTGSRFYKDPNDFMYEAQKMGISRRISTIPRGFELGKTWVLMGHPKAIYNVGAVADAFLAGEDKEKLEAYSPGIFTVFKPTAIEEIVTDKQAADKKFMAQFEARNKKLHVKVTPIVVPYDDKDHAGSVWDKENDEDE